MEQKVITGPEHTAPFCGSVVIHGLTSGRTEEIEFRGSPKPDIAKVARFAVGVGYDLHRRLLRTCPSIKWFVSAVDTVADRLGFADTVGGYVALADHLEGRELVEVALHELRHLAQRGLKFTDAEAEADAAGFAHRWTPVLLRAYRETKGQLSRLRVVDKPFVAGRAPHMSLHLCRPTARLWEYNARTMSDAWKELRPDY